MLVVDSYSTLESNNMVITAVILLKLHHNMNGNHVYNLILDNLNGIELMLISCACSQLHARCVRMGMLKLAMSKVASQEERAQ